MDISNLPPKPDIQTGEPRPPHGPLEPGRNRSGERRQGGERKVPQPPAGEGPLLEWYYPDRAGRIVAGLFVSFLCLIVYVLKDWGFSWVANPWLWLVAAPWPFVFLLIGKSARMSAGADWLACGKGFVKTYELKSVKVTVGGAAHYLEIKDHHGKGIYTQINELQQNHELWDLVYNGILHSVYVGKAETNKRAWDYLSLEFPPHLATP